MTSVRLSGIGFEHLMRKKGTRFRYSTAVKREVDNVAAIFDHRRLCIVIVWMNLYSGEKWGPLVTGSSRLMNLKRFRECYALPVLGTGSTVNGKGLPFVDLQSTAI
jgi:hypothetical protein